MSDSAQSPQQPEESFLTHLIELRDRVIKGGLAILIAFLGLVYWAPEIFHLLAKPLLDVLPKDAHMIVTDVTGSFFVPIKVTFMVAFVVALPVVLYQLWAFVAPGLYAKEKRAFLPFLVATPVLFLSGAALAYYVVMPTAFAWMLGFQGDRGGIKMEALPAVGDYLGLVMQFIFAFGASFLLPVLLLLLNRAGIVSRAQLSSGRRYVIVGITVLSAVLTPPDVGSQVMLAVPLMLLFEGSLVVMYFSEKKAAAQDEQESPAEG